MNNSEQIKQPEKGITSNALRKTKQIPERLTQQTLNNILEIMNGFGGI